jgi:protein involved in polysaccharide export with SLBB domain
VAASALAAGFLSGARAQQRSFDAWLQELRAEALASRISSATLDAALAGLAPLEEVVARDREQPEFTLDFRSYLARVVSPSRIEEGQRMLAEHGELVRAVGSRYGMPPSLLVAVWGIESNYGRTQGDFPVVQALATLAYDGRRGAMFRRELLNALRILDQGHVELAEMRGSWAGAMGHLQKGIVIEGFKLKDGSGNDIGYYGPADNDWTFKNTLLGCAGAGQYVWYRELPSTERAADAGDYVIGIGDGLNIRVYEQEGLSTDVKIRSDGKIALPLAGEIVAAGKRPAELSAELERKLKEFIVTPRVTVNVTTSHPITVTVMGEVGSVGVLTIEPPARLIDALARSGGLGEYAETDRIFVLRHFPSFKRIRFTWEEILRNEGGSASFPLRSGDVVVVD